MLMFAALPTSSHLWCCEAINAANSIGVQGWTVRPTLIRVALISGFSSPSFRRVLRRVTIAAGVPTGANESEKCVGFGARITCFRYGRHVGRDCHPRLVQYCEHAEFSAGCKAAGENIILEGRFYGLAEHCCDGLAAAAIGYACELCPGVEHERLTSQIWQRTSPAVRIIDFTGICFGVPDEVVHCFPGRRRVHSQNQKAFRNFPNRHEIADRIVARAS